MSHTRNSSVDSVDASRKTRYRPNKDKRGAKATKFPFNIEQEKILYDYGMDLEENINNIARNRPLKNNSFVTAWKKKTAIEILDKPEFKSLNFSKHSLGEWYNVSQMIVATKHFHC